MTGTKKIIKKKLKEPDEFITITERVYLFATQHAKSVAVGAGIVLVLFLFVFFYQQWKTKNEEDAYQLFNSAVAMYQVASSPYREASPQDYKTVLERFNEVVAKFPRTSDGKLAVLYEGNIHLRLGEFDEAIKAYESYLGKAGRERLYRAFAAEGLGYSYEGKREYEKAIDAYQKVVALTQGFQLANAYFGLGRCYEKMGKVKEALENYKGFAKISQKSQMMNIVLRKISTLEK
ncbi:MAG TPA: tetratricopeptide repeat protein [Thermodesulfobacteriota bacterium]|nr:tetratricopeptide repeat protein [Thermodesulfobacteriota bacterium]